MRAPNGLNFHLAEADGALETCPHVLLECSYVLVQVEVSTGAGGDERRRVSVRVAFAVALSATYLPVESRAVHE